MSDKHIGAGDKDMLLTEAGIRAAKAELERLELALPHYEKHYAHNAGLMRERITALKDWLDSHDHIDP